MLSLVLTKTKLYASADVEGKSKKIEINGKPYVYLGQKPLPKTWENGLDSISKAYASQVQSLGKQKEDTIPVAIAYAVAEENGPQDLLSDFKKILSQNKQGNYELIYSEPLPFSYIRGQNGNPKKALERSIVLEALDDQVNLCYCNIPKEKLNGKQGIGDDFRYMSFKDLGRSAAVNAIFENVSKQFVDAGIQLDSRDQAALRAIVSREVENPSEKHSFALNKKKGNVNIRAELSLNSQDFSKLMTGNLNSLRASLGKANLEELKVRQIVTIGEFFDNTHLKKFLGTEMKLAPLMSTASTRGSANDYEYIFKGLTYQASAVLGEKLAEIEKRKTETLKKQALETELRLKTEKEKLLMDIRTSCKDASKREAYESKFVAQGAKLNMPKEVIVWNIEEALSSAALNIPAPTQSLTPITPVQRQSSTAKSTAPTTKGSPQVLPIKNQYNILGVLLDPEFNTKKATTKRGEQVVIRLLNNTLAKNPEKVADFKKLYDKELRYYKELSEITVAAEGSYYHRAYIKRESLKDYVKKIGLADKLTFSKYNSKDIKFILSILDEVKSLPVGHANLNEFNILVHKQSRWSSAIDINFIGFTSKDASAKEMLNRTHEIFTTLLKPKAYKEFRTKLNL